MRSRVFIGSFRAPRVNWRLEALLIWGGSVATGIRGLWVRWPTRKVERRALSGSYVGGAVGVIAAFADAVIRYGIVK